MFVDFNKTFKDFYAPKKPFPKGSPCKNCKEHRSHGAI